jgi:hypothetical protein
MVPVFETLGTIFARFKRRDQMCNLETANVFNPYIIDQIYIYIYIYILFLFKFEMKMCSLKINILAPSPTVRAELQTFHSEHLRP